MKLIGLTGGIGSGKSVVAALLNFYGIPVYNSDTRSKELCVTNASLIAGLKQLLGAEVYLPNGVLNKSYMAKAIFSDAELMKASNQLIHPYVINDFNAWANRQKAAIVIHESALIIDASLGHLFESIICVTAPESLRIERVCSRDGLSIEQVKNRIKNQLSDQERIAHAHYVVINDGFNPLIPQVEILLKSLRS